MKKAMKSDTSQAERRGMLFVVLLLCALVVTPELSARRRKTKKAETAVAADTLCYEMRRKFNTYFLTAVTSKEKGNFDAAYDMLRRCLGIDPNAPEVLYSMGNMLTVFSPDDTTGRALKMMQRAAALEPDNYYYQSGLASYYDSEGLADSAVARYELMSRRFPEKTDLLYRLTDIYQTRKDYRGVIRTFDRLELKEGRDQTFSFNKAIAYFRLGDTVKAMAIADSLFFADTSNVRARVFRGTLLYDAGQKDKALVQYSEALREDPSNEQANMAMLSHFVTVNDTAGYLKQAAKVVMDPGISREARLKVLGTLTLYCARGVVDSTAALPLFRKVAAGSDTDASLLDMYQAYMQMLKLPEDSLMPVWKRLLSLKPDYSQVRIKVLSDAVRRADNPDIVSLCTEGLEYEPDNLAYYFYGALALYSQDSTASAEKMMRSGITHISDKTDSELASDMYSILGDICHKLGKREECFKAYDSALSYKEDNISVLNNYAYFLSLEKRDLDRALKMSERTVKAEPANPTYLDTYAWILFQMRDYEGARLYIDSALSYIKPEKDNASVYEHAGDIAACCGKRALALKMWRKANALGLSSATLRRKIRLGKYIE